jgi:AcrR family transcriptional regulator
MRDYDGKTAVERVAERRTRLVDAGLEVFGSRGYAGTSVRAVLRHAGLIDRYWAENFADLDDLLAAVFDRLIADEWEACRIAIDTASGSSAGARAMIDTIARILENDPRRARVKLQEVLSGGPACQHRRQEGLHKLGELVAGLLPATGRKRRRLLLGIGVVAAADEYLRMWLQEPSRMTRAEVVGMVMNMFDSLSAALAPEAVELTTTHA